MLCKYYFEFFFSTRCNVFVKPTTSMVGPSISLRTQVAIQSSGVPADTLNVRQVSAAPSERGLLQNDWTKQMY